MAFIDNLAFSLFAISFAGFLLLYALVSIYRSYRKKQKNFSSHMEGASIPLSFLGIYMLVMGLWGQFTWPLPGQYNILFYDPLVAFGLVLIIVFVSIRFKVKLEYTGFLGSMLGVMAIIYGVVGYNQNLTSEPLALLGMYLAYGCVGILAYPVSLLADRLSSFNGKPQKSWSALLVLFCIFLLLASALAGFVAIGAITQHLVLAP